ncbi:MAG: hypothetical protein GEU90_03230 [Gemmatimonas sp.]|nr:hypothetical protein [Gemmatimonas sp.]
MTGMDANNDEGNRVLKLARDRDAYATIRGFVYQVDLTILRWLDLAEDEVLELERGEDIDRLSRGIENFGGWERLLEQVKHVERNVTLRSRSVRAALANFFEHGSLNNERILRFRFTTNARIGTESPNPIPDGQPGLVAWQQLHEAKTPKAESAVVIAGIRQLLIDGSRPPGLDEDTWKAWKAFVATAEDALLASFVGQVEIATGTAGAADLQSEIEARLQDQDFASDGSAATNLYQVLFVSVFKRLSTRGLKRLDRDGLLSEAAGTGMGAIDADLAGKLAQFREQVDSRLEVLKAELDLLQATMIELQGEVSEVARGVAETKVPRGVRVGDTHTFQTTGNHFGRNLDPDSTFNHARPLVDREEILSVAGEEVEDVLTHGSGIVVLSGAGGVGKSRLLLEVARKLDERGEFQVRWVRDTETPGTHALNELPEGPVAIFSDDAHRRSDLPDVLVYVR